MLNSIAQGNIMTWAPTLVGGMVQLIEIMISASTAMHAHACVYTCARPRLSTDEILVMAIKDGQPCSPALQACKQMLWRSDLG